jgi:chromosome segregation ATPase
MTIAEKKVAQANLKTAIKANLASSKALAADVKAAEQALAQAKKDADKRIKECQKTLDTVKAKTAKAQDAAAKGNAKLTQQLTELEAKEAVRSPRGSLTPTKQPEPA